ncbi:MAG: ankyrin repeat domain-containing protein [Gammaproteobacteria bacterium]
MQYPSLAKAIIYGNITDVVPWLENGTDIDDYDEYGFTPLIEAVIFRKHDIVTALLERGADTNSLSVTGHSALHWAAEIGDAHLCELLLEKGANANSYSRSGQPTLVLPLLRNQTDVKQAIYQHGASLNFAQDFIQAKLLAHRFELIGPVDIVNHEKRFIQLDMEGFFLEFTLSIVESSLTRFKNSFAARHLRQYFPYFDAIIQAFHTASELIRYQHFTLKYEQFEQRIDSLLNQLPLLLPVGYEGHAITFINYADILVKCDRGEWGKEHGSVVIYRMTKPTLFNKNLIKQLIYKKQSKQSITEELPEYLGLVPLTQIPIPVQITGNCSWANTEASVAVMLFILQMAQYKIHNPDLVIQCKQNALSIYRQWLSWDKSTALSEFLQSMEQASGERKVSKLMQLAAFMFQKLRSSRISDIRLAERILPHLLEPQHAYILQSYKQMFYLDKRTPQGINLMHLIEAAGYYV